MNKIITALVGFFFFITNSFGCSCDIAKPAVEFAYSDYVFEGLVTSKEYASDSLTYTITFDIKHHYKSGDSPAKLNFTLISEGEYTGVFTSCDWNVEKDEKWLVYAYRSKGELTFGFLCSNSKPLINREINESEQRVLENGNMLNIDKYRFSVLDGFYFQARPKANIDSILNIYKKNNYEDNRIDIIVDIDKEGNLEAANLRTKNFQNRSINTVTDSIFNLRKTPNIKVREPSSRAEKDLLELVRNLKKWDKTYLPFSKKSIAYRMFMQFYIEQDTILVYY